MKYMLFEKLFLFYRIKWEVPISSNHILCLRGAIFVFTKLICVLVPATAADGIQQ